MTKKTILIVKSEDPRHDDLKFEIPSSLISPGLKEKRNHQNLIVPLRINSHTDYIKFSDAKNNEYHLINLSDQDKRDFWGVSSLSSPEQGLGEKSRYYALKQTKGRHVDVKAYDVLLIVKPFFDGASSDNENKSYLAYNFTKILLIIDRFKVDYDFCFIDNSTMSGLTHSKREELSSPFVGSLDLDQKKQTLIEEILATNFDRLQTDLIDKFASSKAKNFIEDIIDMVSIIETILVPEGGSELIFKIQIRYGIIFAHNIDELKVNMKVLKWAYNQRSKWLHSSKQKATPIKENREYYNQLYRICSECLCRYLINSDLFKRKSIEELTLLKLTKS